MALRVVVVGLGPRGQDWLRELQAAGHELVAAVDNDPAVLRQTAGKKISPAKCFNALEALYRAVDREIGRLVDVIGSEAKVIVFSLHGMRPALGVPAFLGPLLCERGFSRLADLRAQSWTTRARSAFAAAKRHSPETIKKIYYKLTPKAAALERGRLARLR